MKCRLYPAWLNLVSLFPASQPTVFAAVHPAKRVLYCHGRHRFAEKPGRLTRDWPDNPPPFRTRWQQIQAVAEIARVMHGNGICHRDFYLCHFMISPKDSSTGEVSLTLMDLHRALCKSRLGRRWIIKDLAGLYFSAMDIGLTRNDLIRFVLAYSGKNLRQVVREDAGFWGKVSDRALRMKARHSSG